MRAIWNARFGNPDDPADQDLLRSACPLSAADRITIAILIRSGSKRRQVVQSQSEQIVTAIERNRGLVTCVRNADEGHTWG